MRLSYLFASMLLISNSAIAAPSVFDFSPIEIDNNINVACKFSCNEEKEFEHFRNNYNGNITGKTVNFIDKRINKVTKSVVIEDIYTTPVSTGVSITPLADDQNRTMDGGLDCNIDSNEPWCDAAWNTNPEWENYLVSVNNSIFNVRLQHIVTAKDVQISGYINTALWGLVTTVPAGAVSSTVLKMIEKLGIQAVNSWALQSIIGASLAVSINSLSALDFKEGDVIVFENGKRKLIRNGVVINEFDLVPAGYSGSAQIGSGGGGEGYVGLPGDTGGQRSFCLIRSWGTVTTGGGVTFWVDYSPCPTGIYEP